MAEIKNFVKKFDPITLSQMDEVKLMNRADTKFTFRKNQLFEILPLMLDHYRILEIDDLRIQDYRCLYYDTEDRKFYIDHHNQRVNRNKIRFREYVNSGLTFMEIKLKNNKGKTIKKRKKVKKIPLVLSQDHLEYMYNIIGNELNVVPKQWINFSRMTFVHKAYKERLTIDLDLNFKYDNREIFMDDIVIAEVKQERVSRQSDFMRITKEMSILPMRLSKYCFSTMKLESDIKQNRFKKKSLFIKKLQNES